MRTVLATLALGLIAQPVLALSCMAPDVARSTQAAMDSPDRYRIVSGILEFDPVTPPFDGTSLGDDETASFPARVSGYALTASGFDDTTQDRILVTTSCLMGSCGTVEPRVDMLMFLRVGENGPVLELGPCPQWAFAEPTDAQKQTVLSCIMGDCPTD